MWGMEKDVNADVTKCAVDTKEIRIVQIKAVCEALQRYLAMLSDRAIKREREFSVNECKIIYVVKSKHDCMYTMLGSNYLPSVKGPAVVPGRGGSTGAQCRGAETNIRSQGGSTSVPVHKSCCAHVLFHFLSQKG